MNLGKWLMISGSILFLLGLLFFFREKFFFLKYLGRLPGDISVKKEGFSFYFPLTTSILFSFLISFIIWLINHLK